MQTKKKLPTRNAAQEHASPRISRPQKKVPECVKVVENKVTELITSSVRKQRIGYVPKKSREPAAVKNLNPSHKLTCDGDRSRSLGNDTANGASIDHKGSHDETGECTLDTIFSPAFHVSKDVGVLANGVSFVKFFRSEDHKNSGITEPVDALRSIVSLQTSNPTGKDEQKNYGQNIETETDTICSVDMDVDSDISSEHLDMQNSSHQKPPLEFNGVSHCNKDLVAAGLSSEVSAIYLAMQQSKLECVDELSHDSISTDICVETEEIEELDDFDPYFFIKNLPDLSSVVPTFRPMLLPKQTRSCPRTTLVLDLDETLVHSTLEHCNNADFTFSVNFNFKEHTVYVRCRPHLKDFMERVAKLFEIIIFTASQAIYAEQLLNVLDPKRRVFRHRVYRESCVFVEGNYLKDLSVLGRDLAHVIIIDNSPQAFGFQVDNGIPIESWFDDPLDQELLLLLPFLESLVAVEDVRPLIAKRFNLREKIAAAVYPSLNSNRRDPFER
ncbi:CTD small phosphatase-like protein 2 isoform X1 [Macadamia integrifolia]|uniref:CTD small phosphatase-like protein 2 isoform X1 n=1 Tax=Macadamia integrifolia TaxID=60698 RepID=UPI001C4F07E3|nr:CTD small phosphatase-like protein 2 isoform X1 [Macadamia integrifolia]